MIYVDDRSGSAELAPLLSSPHRIQRLSYADFSFLGNGPTGPATFGLERKAILDLVSSIDSGRLSGHQLIGLLGEYDRTYIIVEGRWRARPRDGILERMVGKRWRAVEFGTRRFSAKYVINFLNTLSMAAGVTVWYTEDVAQTAYWLDTTYAWAQKEWEAHSSHLKAYSPPPPYIYLRKPGVVQRVAKELAGGVGWDKGRAIAEHFPTVLSLAMAGEKELRAVPGIGKKLAADIMKGIRNE